LPENGVRLFLVPAAYMSILQESLMRLFKTGLVAVALTFGPSAFAQKKWDMATAFVPNNFHVVNLAEFATDVEKGTQGQLRIALHANSSLFKGSEIKRAVQGGQIQAGEILMTAYENESPVLGVDGVPFLATSYADARKLYDAQKPVLKTYLEKQGLVLLYCVPWPAAGIYSKRPVASIADMRGIKWRAYSPATTRMGELMQAKPVTVQPAELSQALTTGVVEAFMTSTQTGVDSRAYEQVTYFYDLQASLSKNAVFVNAKAFQALDAAQQAAVLKAAAAAEERGWRLSDDWNEASKKTLREKGMTVSEPSPALRADVQRLGQQLLQDWQKKAGPEGDAIVAQYQKLRASNSQAVQK
jgi:TRAP-type C4-dicarboxylate transport system substrate-binding protein